MLNLVLSALFLFNLGLPFPSCFPLDSSLNQNASDLPGLLFCSWPEGKFLTLVTSSPSGRDGQTNRALPLPFPQW